MNRLRPPLARTESLRRLLLAQVLFVFLGAEARAQIGPLKVRPPDPFVGTVVDSDGKPVADAEVYIVRVDPQFGAAFGFVETGPTRTDARGEFEVADEGAVETLPSMALPAVGWIVAYHPGFSVGSAQFAGPNAMRSGDPSRIVLEPSGRASFRVVGPDGDPVAGARIKLKRVGYPNVGALSAPLPRALSERLSAVTDAHGDVSLEGAGAGRLAAIEIGASGFGVQETGNLYPAEGLRTVSLRPVGRLSIRVLSAAAAPIRGVAIRGSAFPVKREAGVTVGRVEGTSDADGRLVVAESAEGWVSMVARLRDGDPSLVQTASDRVQLIAGQTTEVEIRMERGTKVFGVVREKGSGRPIAGAALAFLSPSGISIRTPRAVTDSEGLYTGYLLPAAYRIEYSKSAPFRLPAGIGLPEVTVAAGGAPVEIPPIEVIRARDLSGIVLGEDGNTVRAALIEARWADRGTSPPRIAQAATHSSETGEFVLRDLPPDVDVWLVASFEEASSGPPIIMEAGATDPILFGISRENTQSLGGRVVDERGEPIAGAKVRIATRLMMPEGWDFGAELGLPGATHDWNLTTDAQGRFQTPRKLSRFMELSAWAEAPGRVRARNGWFAPTTPSFFDIVLQRTLAPEQESIRRQYSAGERARNRGDLAEAEKQSRAAVDEAVRRHVDDPITMADLLEQLAWTLNEAGKCLEADPFARRALALREKALEPDSPAIARSLLLLGHTLHNEERYDEAESFHRRAMQMAERSLGDWHPDFAHQLYMYGWHLVDRGDHARAEPMLRRALQIQERVLGADAALVGWTAFELGRCAAGLGKLDEDEPLFKRALRIMEKHRGPEDHVVASILESYAYRLRKTNREAEAEPLEARARAIRGKSVKRDAP